MVLLRPVWVMDLSGRIVALGYRHLGPVSLHALPTSRVKEVDWRKSYVPQLAIHPPPDEAELEPPAPHAIPLRGA